LKSIVKVLGFVGAGYANNHGNATLLHLLHALIAIRQERLGQVDARQVCGPRTW